MFKFNKKSRDSLGYLLLLSLFSSVSYAQSCQQLKEVSWLLGSWESNRNNTKTLENWQQVSTSTFEGYGATLVNHEVKSSEALRLVEMADEVFFIAKVGHNSLPVSFKLLACSDNKLIFENKQHDFPKRIEYQLTNEGNMLVIVGDGQQQSFSIEFTRSESKQ